MKHSLAMSSIIANGGSLFSRDAAMSRKISSSTSLSLKILTALIGSPTYFGSLNRTVLTSPAPFSSRQGMTRVANTSAAAGKILEEPHAEPMALLGMKLNTHQVAVLESGIEHRRPVPHREQLILRILASDVEGMREIESRLRRALVKKCALLHGPRHIPAHVRHLQGGIDRTIEP